LAVITAVLIVGYFQSQPVGTAPSAPVTDRALSAAALKRVVDGDTIECDIAGAKAVIRLHGIDAPERDQALGPEATSALADALRRGQVIVQKLSTDQYGRQVANVYCDGVWINRLMVERGLAWHYERYAPDAVELAEAQRRSRWLKAGLWATGGAVAPWDWRQRKRDGSPQGAAAQNVE
jgi:endonuclease YncB( thermonuclease family)